ncbi:hypothetical protein SCITRI_00609 [Spiroplasma citri]|uniref:hypothetical protein n=1 Tax=Spiroplasma citri TaxID=2133 RepID=UPI00090BC2B2|nr:hypothetical protein [Spiroplasma citri]APE74505.1 hypothetical protein SCITRI_00609 [Spiroplasma citri]QED24413.1 hypothetical protein FRX96_02870 [Spiroplasma citri]QIA70438.1 hypothetical protein GL981_03010 [Spiroplasma citri]
MQLLTHKGGTNNIPLSIDRLNDDDKNNVMWVLEKFGRIIPITAKYTWLKNSHINNASELHPKNTDSKQIRWDQAWEWYDEYKKGAIPFLEYRIQIREKELEEDESKFVLYKQEIEYYEIWRKSENKTKWNKIDKPSKTTHKLIKYYEKNIPEQKAEIAKLKIELESLKAKENQKQQQTQPNLLLENENLRLKKEILEMELKLKETNKQR